MGNDLPQKMHRLQTVTVETATGPLLRQCIKSNKDDKSKQTKAQSASALRQSTVVKTHPDLHFLPQMFTPKTWRRGWCTFWKDGVGENGSRDFQMEGLELREPDQQPKKLGFNAERNKVLQQRAEAWFLKTESRGGADRLSPDYLRSAWGLLLTSSAILPIPIAHLKAGQHIAHTKRCCLSLLIALCCHSNG